MRPIIPFEYLAILAVVMLAAGGYFAWKTSVRARRWERIAMVLFRTAALAGLVAVALNPGEWMREWEDHPDQWAVLIDRSRSMQFKDADGQSRISTALRLAAKAADAVAEAGGDLSLYTFADRLDPVSPEDLATVGADGATTEILRAGDNLLASHRGGQRGLKGIVLLSDGRPTGSNPSSDFAIRARARNTPVYPIVLGGEVARKDISLSPGRHHYVAFAGQQTKVSAIVSAQGFDRITPTIRLIDGDGELLEERRISLEPNEEKRVSFQLTAESEGYRKYRFEIPPWESESNPANNTAEIGLSALAEEMRVLFIEGTPFWDTKFSVQLLRNQPNIDISTIYRLAADRFFRIDTRNETVAESKQSIFPEDIAQLGRYDIVIFGKGAEYFLDDERIALLRTYLRELGGSVLFGRGKPYRGTMPALETIEPVVWGAPVGRKLPLMPTRAGEEAGLFGDLLPAPRDPVWEKMPELGGLNSCEDTKTFSRVLAEGRYSVARRDRSIPIIVSRRFGKGMVVVVNAEGFWHWDFFPGDAESGQIYKDLWIQLIHWMATYSEYLPGQEYALHLDDDNVLPGTSVRVRIGRRGRDAAVDKPSVVVRRDGAIVQEVVAAESGSEANRWDAVLRIDDPGYYRIGVGGAVGSGEMLVDRTLLVRPLPTETDELSADREYLAELADISGGSLISEKDMESLLAAGKDERAIAETSRAVWVPLWDSLWLLLAIVALFSAEWFLRRRNGLM